LGRKELSSQYLELNGYEAIYLFDFQVSSKLYGILSILAENCPSFGRSCVALCVTHLTEKLGDAKLKKPAGDTLTLFAEKTSLQFVLNQGMTIYSILRIILRPFSAYDPLSKQKAPKVLADALVWVNTAITEFGIAGLSLRALIDFLKLALQNSNAGVRSSATKALVTLKLYAGSSEHYPCSRPATMSQWLFRHQRSDTRPKHPTFEYDHR